MADLDPRIVRLTIQVQGQLKVYEGLDIKSTGCKYANPLQNEAQVEVANLTKADRDYILTATSPYNEDRTPKTLLLEAGRKSYGVTKIYRGDISSCTPTQPPDVVLKFKCKTNQYLKGNIISTAQPSISTLRAIAAQAAIDNALQLNFQATDINVSNYAFTGPSIKQVDRIAGLGALDAYADDRQLVVKEQGVPLVGKIRVLDGQSGMVGIPELTEQGLKITYVLDNTTVEGGGLQVVSQIYPTADGLYVIYKLGWNITSRDTPFYWIPECVRTNAAGEILIPTGLTKKRGTKGKRR